MRHLYRYGFGASLFYQAFLTLCFLALGFGSPRANADWMFYNAITDTIVNGDYQPSGPLTLDEAEALANQVALQRWSKFPGNGWGMCTICKRINMGPPVCGLPLIPGESGTTHPLPAAPIPNYRYNVVINCPWPYLIGYYDSNGQFITTVTGFRTDPMYFYGVWQQTYTIKLSRLDGTSEDNIILDKIAPGGMTNVSGPNTTDTAVLVARVYDQNNQIVPNINIHLVADVVAKSGGHNHDNYDRHQNYAGKMAPLFVGTGTVSEYGKVLDGNTGSNGLAFTFRGPSYPNNPAGDYTIAASCTGGKTCTQQGPNQVWVGIKDLLAIPESSLGLWKLSGGFNPDDPNDPNNQHPNNHYVTQEAAQQLVELASNYHARFPNDPVLNLNDASLERGGLFDIYSWVDADGVAHSRADEPWWTTPHNEHRKGVVIDIQANGANTAIPQKNFKVFEQLLRNSKMTYIFEGSHYHVRLWGISQ